jgi:hypothetical protein
MIARFKKLEDAVLCRDKYLTEYNDIKQQKNKRRDGERKYNNSSF